MVGQQAHRADFPREELKWDRLHHCLDCLRLGEEEDPLYLLEHLLEDLLGDLLQDSLDDLLAEFLQTKEVLMGQMEQHQLASYEVREYFLLYWDRLVQSILLLPVVLPCHSVQVV